MNEADTAGARAAAGHRARRESSSGHIQSGVELAKASTKEEGVKSCSKWRKQDPGAGIGSSSDRGYRSPPLLVDCSSLLSAVVCLLPAAAAAAVVLRGVHTLLWTNADLLTYL